ncbi:hypothetical protein [Knoellia aerolata]|uniref:Uncharacterized protein n=1 Tax=Knoellia aerolata DSM 18566 TaxID=1385519 RepID=A0A0A0JUL1_9MICO|nr:hypothetical protein [Knoellia aerolata]KGN41035.1 hypothetical protein N801_09755 [Knoellia aerolata DSM 18566]
MTNSDHTPRWGRRRLLAALTGAALLAVTLIAGLGYLLVDAVTGPATATPVQASLKAVSAAAPERRDQLAAAPMLKVDPAAGRKGTPAATSSPAIAVPPATREGPAGVPSGFLRTPAGAVGQLAAIDTTVVAAMSVDRTREIHRAWALPGAPAVGRWVMTDNVRAFLAAAGPAAPAGAPPAVVAIPAAGQVKGTDGPSWVVACVLLRVDATIARTATIAYGHCERMQWNDDRWQIGPGAQPATAPSTWPGTDLAASAGWLAWAETGQG